MAADSLDAMMLRANRDGATQQEIAELVRMSVGTVNKRIRERERQEK